MPQPVIAATLFFSLLGMVAGCSRQPPREAASGTAPIAAPPRAIDVWNTAHDDKQRMLLLLQPRTVVADVLTMFGPPDLGGIAIRAREAAQRDPAVAMEILKNKDAEGVVKYDPRMGISRQEYERFLQVPSLTELKKTGQAKLEIARSGDAAIRITGLPDLDEVVFDASKLSVSTPFGTLERAKSVAPNDRQHLTGKIAGISWRSSSVGSLLLDEHTLWVVLLAQSQETRDVVMQFRVKNNETGQDQLHYFVRFPGPR